MIIMLQNSTIVMKQLKGNVIEISSAQPLRIENGQNNSPL